MHRSYILRRNPQGSVPVTIMGIADIWNRIVACVRQHRALDWLVPLEQAWSVLEKTSLSRHGVASSTGSVARASASSPEREYLGYSKLLSTKVEDSTLVSGIASPRLSRINHVTGTVTAVFRPPKFVSLQYSWGCLLLTTLSIFLRRSSSSSGN